MCERDKTSSPARPSKVNICVCGEDRVRGVSGLMCRSQSGQRSLGLVTRQTKLQSWPAGISLHSALTDVVLTLAGKSGCFAQPSQSVPHNTLNVTACVMPGRMCHYTSVCLRILLMLVTLNWPLIGMATIPTLSLSGLIWQGRGATWWGKPPRGHSPPHHGPREQPSR